MTAIEKYGELQEAFFDKTGKLYENIETLGNELYESMLKDLIKVYQKESAFLLREIEIEREARNYKLDCKEDLLIPAPCGLFRRRRNKPADIIFREINCEVQESFNRRTVALEKLEAALEAATKEARPDEEPQELEQQQPDELEQKQAVKPAKKTAQQPAQDVKKDGAAPSIPLTAEKKAVKPQPCKNE